LPKYTPEDTAALLIRGNVFDFDFVGVPVFGVEPVTVLFTAVGFTPTDYWHWNFGDGFTAVGATVSHTYSAGVYDVTLTTGALLWGFSSRTKLQYVRVLRTPFVGRRVDFTEFVIEGSEAVVQVIPMRSNPCFTEEVELDSVPYLFKFYWSVKSSAWFFDISTNGTLLAAGLPLRIGVDAFSRRRHISGMPKGTLLVVDVSNRLSDPIAFDDFTGARGLQLVYSPVEEA
jgi:PKD repeat protein